MAKTLVVSIGRNVGREAMSKSDWLWFRARVARELYARDAEVVFGGTGKGFDPETNSTEESATWVAVIDEETFPLQGLRMDLADLAADYDQESIALTVGDTEFVEAAS